MGQKYRGRGWIFDKFIGIWLDSQRCMYNRSCKPVIFLWILPYLTMIIESCCQNLQIGCFFICSQQSSHTIFHRTMNNKLSIVQTQSLCLNPITNLKTINRDKAFKTLCQQFQKKQLSLYLQGSHDRTVRIGSKIPKDKVILTFPEKFFLKQSAISGSPLLAYIKIIAAIRKTGKENSYKCSQGITRSHQQRHFSQEDISKISKISLDILSLIQKGLIIYLIQRKFMPNAGVQHPNEEIERIHASYIESLPSHYTFHPQNFLKDIESFHPEWFYSQQCYTTQLQSWWLIIRQIIKNQCRLSFSFKTFLAHQGKQQLYQSYEWEFTRQRVFWVMQVLRTRHYESFGLIPLLDMFNHSCDSSKKTNVRYKFNNVSRQMEVYTIFPIEEKDELLLSYNQSSDMQSFFYSYGFLGHEEPCNLFLGFNYNNENWWINLISDERKEGFVKNLVENLSAWIKVKEKEETSPLRGNWKMAVISILERCEPTYQEKLAIVGELQVEMQRETNKRRLQFLHSIKEINLREMEFLKRMESESKTIMAHFLKN